jgi:heme ABC exporter ATP-binding subunit CcmA
VTEKLAKQFGGLAALRSVSLAIQSGESVVVFGRNGAGKTTLLKIVASLIRSYDGTARLFGEDLKRAPHKIRQRFGLVSHESFLYADLSVRDNLTFFGRLYRLESIEAAVETMIDDMELRTKATSAVRTLSRGLKQRVALARAFLHRPDLVLLDEPFTGLDERAATVLDKFIDTMRADGRTVIITTHDAARGWKHADRAVILDRGEIAYQADTAAESYESFHKTYREILAT